jgi:hypothetical protein
MRRLKGFCFQSKLSFNLKHSALHHMYMCLAALFRMRPASHVLISLSGFVGCKPMVLGCKAVNCDSR